MQQDSPLGALSTWLAATSASDWLWSVSESRPLLLLAIQVLHLLGMAVVVTVNARLAFALLGWLPAGEPLADTVRRGVPWVLGALAVMAASGLVLIIRWPSRILLSGSFVPKLAIIAGATLVLLATSRWLQRPGAEPRDRSVPGRTFGAALIVLWSAAVVAGRWIPFS